MLRRFALVVGLSVLLALGFGAAYVSSGGLRGHQPVTICHKPGTRAEHTITVDDDAVQAHLDHGDYLGECQGLTVTETSATTTLTSVTETTTVPITETDPPTTVTVPPETTSTGITVTVPVPPDTTTVPETTTIVTVPPDSTTTVTVPGETVTQPPVTTTIPGGTTTIPAETVTQPPVTTTVAGGTTTTTPGQTVTQPAVTATIPSEIIERQSETVTLPGATTTVAAAGTTTVVTVTGPNEIVHPGIVVKQRVQAKFKQPRRLIHVAGRIHRERARVRFPVAKVILVVHRTVIVVGNALRGCPPGSKPFKGTCRPVVRGKG